MFNNSIRHSAELDRIISMPRRTAETAMEYADQLSELLRKPGGTMSLRKHQALTLHDLAICRGAFCGIETGGGKTLTSALAAEVLEAKKPMLVMPANLIQKTSEEFQVLRQHWHIPNNIYLFSYEMLGREEYALHLEDYQPDLLLFEEGHNLKNQNAARTRRVERYRHSHPEVPFVIFTGTPMRKSVKDYEHLLMWCLGRNAPIPFTENERDEWACALDDFDDELRRYAPGALLKLADEMGIDRKLPDLLRARLGFQKRLVETPGVIITSSDDGEKVDSKITIRALTYEMSSVTEAHFKRLRSEMITPDDWQLMERVEVWMHARQLALGFHSIWSPRPPEDWRSARKAWNGFVRGILSNSRTLDSPKQVESACDQGRLPSGALNEWRRIDEASGFIPNSVPLWHDDSALLFVKKWMEESPGIVWTEHVPFAERLAELMNAKYYGSKGLTENGEFVDHDSGERSIIVSVDANREGRNLQHRWCRNLITSPPHGSDLWQQLIARTHRSLQTRDVTVDVLLGCLEHVKAWRQAILSSELVRDTTGADRKILTANVQWPDDLEIECFEGPRWREPPPEKFEIPGT